MLKRLVLIACVCGTLLSAVAAQAEDKLLLVHREDLMGSAPDESVLGQEFWTMHETDLSRTSMIKLKEKSPAVSHAEGERTLIVLQGNVEVSFADQAQTLVEGDYIAIPENRSYSLEPTGDQETLLLAFDVPKIEMSNASSSDVAASDDAPLPIIKIQSQIMAGPTGWNDPSDRGWTLAKTDQKRVNLVEMFSELKNHSHPDADHSLILLSGEARVVTPDEDYLLQAGDYVSIPQNVPHKYFVEGTSSAVFVSFDAPAYDPSKTIYLE